MEASAHIELSGIAKRYSSRSGPVDAIRFVSFSVPEGGFLSILGPSGCGKSTLLSIIAGLLPPSDGTVAIEGRPVTEPRTDIGMIFQSPVLLPWRTVLDNVLFPIEILRWDRRDYRDRALQLLKITGLLEFKDRLPSVLSGGMRQRVSICRALVYDPRILLMDEPFSALDALTRDEMNLELLRIWEAERKTVVFVTHSIREAVFLSDRVLVMSMRPSVMIEDVRIDLPRPRTIELNEDVHFNQLCGQLRAAINRSHQVAGGVTEAV
jgi:NitT/TauT family transport system ATP-binding protein